MLNNYTFLKLVERIINTKIDELKKENGYHLLRYVFAPICVLLSKMEPLSFKINGIIYSVSTNYWQLFFILVSALSILTSFSFFRSLFIKALLKIGIDLYDKKFGLTFQKSIDKFNSESILLLKDVQLFNYMLNKTCDENIELFVYSVHSDLFKIIDELGLFSLSVISNKNKKNKTESDCQSAILSFNRIHFILEKILKKLSSKVDNISPDGAREYFDSLLREFSQIKRLDL